MAVNKLSYEYKVLLVEKAEDLQEKLDQECTGGWRLWKLTDSGQPQGGPLGRAYTAVLEKPKDQ